MLKFVQWNKLKYIEYEIKDNDKNIFYWRRCFKVLIKSNNSKKFAIFSYYESTYKKGLMRVTALRFATFI